jgi:hypothetical protein
MGQTAGEVEIPYLSPLPRAGSPGRLIFLLPAGCVPGYGETFLLPTGHFPGHVETSTAQFQRAYLPGTESSFSLPLPADETAVVVHISSFPSRGRNHRGSWALSLPPLSATIPRPVCEHFLPAGEIAWDMEPSSFSRPAGQNPGHVRISYLYFMRVQPPIKASSLSSSLTRTKTARARCNPFFPFTRSPQGRQQISINGTF